MIHSHKKSYGTPWLELGWDVRRDNICIEIGGTSVYEIEGDGTKWAPIKGTRKYNKDAFIVIKNRSRDPFVPSQAPENGTDKAE